MKQEVKDRLSAFVTKQALELRIKELADTLSEYYVSHARLEQKLVTVDSKI